MTVHTAEDGVRSVTRLHASGHVNDTETTISDHGGSRVSGTIRCVPGLLWWTRPDAATLRKWADELLEGTGRKRSGAIQFHNHTVTAWHFVYYLTPIAAENAPDGYLDVWLRIPEFDDEGNENEEAEAEANIREDRGAYVADWYLTAVGLVKSSERFPTYSDARAWLTAEGFDDYSA